MNNISTAKHMQQIDAKTINEGYKTQSELMENAGKITAELALNHFKIKKNSKILVIAGPGNNGGDGFVTARYLQKSGYEIHLLLLNDKEKYRDSAKENLEKVSTKNYKFIKLPLKISGYSLIIDAIFGIGLTRQAQGDFKVIIELINKAKTPIISVDIPSGLSADKNIIPGPAVKANMTVTFGLPKVAHFLYPAKEYIGLLKIADIGFPVHLLEEDTGFHFIDSNFSLKYLPQRWNISHKTNYGHLLIFGGSPGKTGAVYMASESALECGTGLVTILCDEKINNILEIKTTEAMTQPINLSSPIITSLDKHNVLLAGPGSSTENGVINLFKKLIKDFNGTFVIDADGLNIISSNNDLLKSFKKPPVFTPHYGEFSRLTGIPVDKLKKDKILYARNYSKSNNVYLVLKGEDTIISNPAGEIFISTTGNAGLAKGGSGDVLSGIISGILIQNLKASSDKTRHKDIITGSLCLGTWLHGKTAELTQKNIRSVKATDLINNISKALNILDNEIYV